MRDKLDRYQVESVPLMRGNRRLGSYLMEAGLLSPAQVEVILNDQKATGMRFGEIAVQRQWLKEQTVEFFATKVMKLEPSAPPRAAEPAKRSAPPPPPLAGRRPDRVLITKPLTSNPSSDPNNEVTWVG